MLKHTFFTEVLLSNPYRLRLIVDYVQIYLERRTYVENESEKFYRGMVPKLHQNASLFGCPSAYKCKESGGEGS